MDEARVSAPWGAPEPVTGVVTLGTRRRVCVWRRWAQGRAEAWEPMLLGKLRI